MRSPGTAKWQHDIVRFYSRQILSGIDRPDSVVPGDGPLRSVRDVIASFPPPSEPPAEIKDRIGELLEFARNELDLPDRDLVLNGPKDPECILANTINALRAQPPDSIVYDHIRISIPDHLSERAEQTTDSHELSRLIVAAIQHITETESRRRLGNEYGRVRVIANIADDTARIKSLTTALLLVPESHPEAPERNRYLSTFWTSFVRVLDELERTCRTFVVVSPDGSAKEHPFQAWSYCSSSLSGKLGSAAEELFRHLARYSANGRVRQYHRDAITLWTTARDFARDYSAILEPDVMQLEKTASTATTALSRESRMLVSDSERKQDLAAELDELRATLQHLTDQHDREATSLAAEQAQMDKLENDLIACKQKRDQLADQIRAAGNTMEQWEDQYVQDVRDDRFSGPLDMSAVTQLSETIGSFVSKSADVEVELSRLESDIWSQHLAVSIAQDRLAIARSRVEYQQSLCDARQAEYDAYAADLQRRMQLHDANATTLAEFAEIVTEISSYLDQIHRSAAEAELPRLRPIDLPIGFGSLNDSKN